MMPLQVLIVVVDYFFLLQLDQRERFIIGTILISMIVLDLLLLLLFSDCLLDFSSILLIAWRFEFIYLNFTLLHVSFALLNSSIDNLLSRFQAFAISVWYVPLHHFSVLFARWF